jgi:hypothetical protein
LHYTRAALLSPDVVSDSPDQSFVFIPYVPFPSKYFGQKKEFVFVVSANITAKFEVNLVFYGAVLHGAYVRRSDILARKWVRLSVRN